MNVHELSKTCGFLNIAVSRVPLIYVKVVHVDESTNLYYVYNLLIEGLLLIYNII